MQWYSPWLAHTRLSVWPPVLLRRREREEGRGKGKKGKKGRRREGEKKKKEERKEERDLLFSIFMYRSKIQG